MKKTFTIITILITLSLIGIIVIQISWIKNMLLLQKEQVRERVSRATELVGDELELHKGSYAAGGQKPYIDDNSPIDFLKPNTVSQQFSLDEIRRKLQKAFDDNNLREIHFEFGIAYLNKNGIEITFTRQSENFMAYLVDSVNYRPFIVPLISPSGSPTENLSPDEYFYVIIPNIKNLILGSLRWRIIMSGAFTIIILAAFYLTVRTMLRQKKLGEIKNDFINNMTHEFKTPIATISLAVDAMKNEKVIHDREKMGYFSGIIKEENQRMNRQVETILRASQLEKQEVDLNLRPIHVHEVIGDVVDNFALQLEDKNGKIEIDLKATHDLISADEVHFSNLVNNLIDNAVKYSKENTPPVIKLSTQSNAKTFTMRIEDNGIGMTRDTVKRIFERFYRAHTGNVHNVKGFGLGLSYVKTMVEAQDGDIKAESTLGKGSIFTVEFPIRKS